MFSLPFRVYTCGRFLVDPLMYMIGLLSPEIASIEDFIQ